MYCRLTRGCSAGEGDVGEASRFDSWAKRARRGISVPKGSACGAKLMAKRPRFTPLRTEQTETVRLRPVLKRASDVIGW